VKAGLGVLPTHIQSWREKVRARAGKSIQERVTGLIRPAHPWRVCDMAHCVLAVGLTQLCW
jgi:hypothetical protein